MNQDDSNLAANGIIHAVTQAFNEIESAFVAPSVLYRPTLSRDGNQWCVLYGEDLQQGVCGFGDSPAEAMGNFDKAWYKKDNK